jgi:Bacterial capsule synthesis protein PGA_cap
MPSSIFVVGDVGPCRPEPGSIFRHVRQTISTADVAICQLEPALSGRGSPLPQARLAMRSDPKVAAAIREAGFHAVSFASNHCMDWGRDAFFDTIGALRAASLEPVGVGANLQEARRPAVFEVNDARVAVLAYNSILPMGYWAEKNRPGCAPMRAWTLYEQIEHDQPGTPARIRTFANRDDLAAMTDDIRQAKQAADVVIIMAHWGIHFVAVSLAEYQLEVAHAAIDAGADLVAGHHPHILKGVEFYRDKLIFYSLGNFALDSPVAFQESVLESKGFSEIAALNPKFGAKGKSFFPPEACRTAIVKCILREGRIDSVSLLPAYINESAEPEMVDATDPRFAEILAYFGAISREAGLNATFYGQGNEIRIHEA